MTTRLIRKIPHPSVETRDDPFNASAFGGDGNLLRLVEDISKSWFPKEPRCSSTGIYLPVMP
jgi:hypothetical protein